MGFKLKIKRLLLAPLLVLSLSGCSTSTLEGRKIVSGSMLPNLQHDDRVLVDKNAYLNIEPKRGDIIAYNSPFRFDKSYLSLRTTPLPSIKECSRGAKDRACDVYIKGVVAISSDQILVTAKGEVYLNSSLIKEPYVSTYCREWLCKKDLTLKVPTNHVFVLGDNRDNSFDSRYWPNYFLPVEQITGKVIKIVWPKEREVEF